MSSNKYRVASIWAGAGLVVALLSISLVFANAFGANRVAANARGLHATNAAMGSVALARVATAQAVVFGLDADLGIVGDESAVAALQEALDTRAAAAAALDVVAPDGDTFLAAVAAVAGALSSGDSATASQLLADVESTYEPLVVALDADQVRFEARITDTEAKAGLAGMITRWLVTLLIPGVALIVYRVLLRRQALIREERLQARLDAEHRLRVARDEFIAGVSHELRTPLTSIYGFSEVLLDQGLLDPEESAELIGLINAESARLSRMVEDLLISARMDAGTLKLSMDRVVVGDEMEAVIGPYRREGAVIDTDDLAHAVRADRERLRHIVRNLIDNAVKHGGSNVWVRGRVVDGLCTISVADDGAGVADDVLPRLFEPFVHDAPEVTGSVGLGLSTARRMARAMGGDVHHWRGDGLTVFVVTLHVDAPVGSTTTGPGSFDLAAAAPA